MLLERLAYFWHKNPYDRERIESIIERARRYIKDMDDSTHVVPYWVVEGYLEHKPSCFDEKEEMIVLIYG